MKQEPGFEFFRPGFCFNLSVEAAIIVIFTEQVHLW